MILNLWYASVLAGASLNDVKGDPSNGFDSSVRAHLGLPAVPVSPDSSLGPASSQSSKSPRTQRMSALEMVASLRKESRSLSTLANDLEGLRQYAHADALRATATKLRLIARQLDIVPESKRSGASTGILQDAGSVPAVRSAN
jgi:hypothetical protein